MGEKIPTVEVQMKSGDSLVVPYPQGISVMRQIENPNSAGIKFFATNDDQNAKPARPSFISKKCICGYKVTAWAEGENPKRECKWLPCIPLDQTIVPDNPDKPSDVKSLTLDKTELSGKVGESVKLVATVDPANAQIGWATTDPKIAAIATDGTVKYVGVGTATIMAKAGDKAAKVTVTVAAADVAVESVALDKTTISGKVGDKVKLTATVKPDNATNKAVTWASTDTTIATVDKDGNVALVKDGKTTVMAKAGDKAATADVTVAEPAPANVPVSEITVDKGTVTLAAKETAKVVATVKPDNATDKTVTWTSADATIATVAADGTITGVKAGTVKVTAKAGDKSVDITVTVK